MNLIDASNFDKYVCTVYWAVSTFTTVGYGDVRAYNTYERLFSIF